MVSVLASVDEVGLTCGDEKLGPALTESRAVNVPRSTLISHILHISLRVRCVNNVFYLVVRQPFALELHFLNRRTSVFLHTCRSVHHIVPQRSCLGQTEVTIYKRIK